MVSLRTTNIIMEQRKVWEVSSGWKSREGWTEEVVLNRVIFYRQKKNASEHVELCKGTVSEKECKKKKKKNLLKTWSWLYD